MNKKLLAAAVAGAFAVPGVALADGSSVTISGLFKVGLENVSISNALPGRANTSEMRMIDNSSRIIFSVKEDLGGGLSAIAQLDNRFNPISGGGGGGAWANGNTWVGLASNDWGQVTFGNRDVHYFHTADTIPGGSTALDAWSVGILGYVNGSAIANDTRTPSVVEYASPKWGIFSFGLAYTANPVVGLQSSDMGPSTGVNRRGDGWNFAPDLRSGPWQAGYSYWTSKADRGVGQPDQRSDRLWGSYKFDMGFYVGLTWDKSRTNDPASGAKLAERNAWSIPLSYSWGPHSVGYTYTKAGDDDVLGNSSGAKLNAIYYQYALSKRTQVGVTYASLNNDSKATYQLFAASPLGSADSVAGAGEDPRALQFTISHTF